MRPASFATSCRGGLADFDTVTAVNFGGVLNVTKAFLPLLDPETGRIINMSSSAGTMFVEKCSPENQVQPYCSTEGLQKTRNCSGLLV